MLRLPRLRPGHADTALPLPEDLADFLADLLLATPAERREMLGARLSEHPTLVLFGICDPEGAASSAQGPPTLAEIAQTLAESLPRRLADGWRQSPLEISHSAKQQRRFRKWARRDRRRAESAEAFAEPPQRAAAWVAALAAGAEDWLGASTAVVGPPWLRSLQARLAENREQLPPPAEMPPAKDVTTEALAGGGQERLLIAVRAALQTVADKKAGKKKADGPAGKRKRTDWPKPGCDAGAARWSDRLPRLAERIAEKERLERQFAEELQRQKQTALYDLAYGASHEVNNPISNISHRAQALLDRETHPETRRTLAQIVHNAYRAHEMISDLMLCAKPPQMQPAPLDLNGLAEEIYAETKEHAAVQATEIVLERASHPVICRADRVHLGAALQALCRNALEAVRTGGRIRIAVRLLEPAVLSEPGAPSPAESRAGWAEIAVTDSGPGIPPELLTRIFNPYCSGREAGRGLGLGLSKCWTIAQQHGGSIAAENGSAEGGAAFRIRLPRLADEREESAGTWATRVPVGSGVDETAAEKAEPAWNINSAG